MNANAEPSLKKQIKPTRLELPDTLAIQGNDDTNTGNIIRQAAKQRPFETRNTTGEENGQTNKAVAEKNWISCPRVFLKQSEGEVTRRRKDKNAARRKEWRKSRIESQRSVISEEECDGVNQTKQQQTAREAKVELERVQVNKSITVRCWRYIRKNAEHSC